MFASLTMPRSMTQMRSATPYLVSMDATISSTVVTSAAVARKRLEGQRQALRRADQADADLFAVAAAVARVAALGLRIALRLAFEVGARHVVEQKLETHAEPIAVTCHQVRTQRVLVDAELVEGAVEPRVVDHRAHRLAQMPIAVTDAAPLLVFPPQEHAASIPLFSLSNKRVFGTTFTSRTRFPRTRNTDTAHSPLKLFSPSARTDELGINHGEGASVQGVE
jgi:hypothetical protein